MKYVFGRWLFYAVIVLGIVVLSAILINLNLQSKTPDSANIVEINTAALIPVTGWAAEFGVQLSVAYELAVQDSSRRLSNVVIKSAIGDTKSSARDAVSAYRYAQTAKSLDLILVESSGASLSVGPLSDSDEVIMISQSANPNLTDSVKFAIRNLISAREESIMVMSHAVNNLGIKNVGFLYLDNEYGDSYKNVFEKLSNELGYGIAISESFGFTTKDFRSLISKIIDKKPEAVYIAAYGSAMGILLKQLRESGYSGKILSTSAVIYDDVLIAANGSAEGVIFADVPFEVTEDNEDWHIFSKRFEEMSGKKPLPSAAMVYDAVNMALDALYNENGNTKKALDHLVNLKQYRGLNGVIMITEGRDLVYPLKLKRIDGGNVRTIE